MFATKLKYPNFFLNMGNSESLKLLVIGPMGHGKSSTGNKILKGNYFTKGKSVGRVTESVQMAEANGIKIVDCPGFGDKDIVFHDSYKTMKAELERMCPFNAIVMMIKFNNRESLQFLRAAEDFIKFFGGPAIECLVIACIQTGEIKYSDAAFQTILYNNEGYRLLLGRNNNTHLHYLLWDNKEPYSNQHDTMISKINQALFFDRQMMKYLYDHIESDLVNNNNRNNQNQQNQNQNQN